MPDEWKKMTGGLESQARHAAAVTPDDGADLEPHARGLYVGAAGDVSVTTIGGDSVTFQGVPAGAVLPVLVARVSATGTTASGIVALW